MTNSKINQLKIKRVNLAKNPNEIEVPIGCNVTWLHDGTAQVSAKNEELINQFKQNAGSTCELEIREDIKHERKTVSKKDQTSFIPNLAINDVFLENKDKEIFLTVEHKDQSKHTAILYSKKEVDVGQDVINTVKQILSKWKKNKISIAEQYSHDRRNESAFLYDTVALAKFVCSMNKNSDNLLNIKEGTTLMHNRILAQILYEYEKVGYQIDPKPTNFVNNKKHDFNINKIRGDVKTVQTLGKLENHPLGGKRLTDECKKSLISSIQEDLESAQVQVGNNGIVVIALWSYKINAILLKYFEKKLSIVPPVLEPNQTILVLSSNTAFEDLYLSFPTSQTISILNHALSEIEIKGLRGISLNYIRHGLPFSISTAPKKGAYISMSYELD